MSLLGIDTSTPASAVCVLRSDGRAFEIAPEPDSILGRPAHARELMPAVAHVMAEADVGFAELEAVAVGVGPGAFTGLRIGVATARGLAAANGLELRPVSSLAALAAGIDAALRLPLIDARRGELFAALHDEDGERWPPFTATPDGLVARVREAGISPLAAGNGSVQFRKALEAGGIRVAPDGAPVHAVRALHVCRLALDAPGAPPEAVLPEYLREPDAKPL
jgi:tRNA threonylcarbamoyladenosine biosynthesis protein TsaB